jgi:hypothetical protein
MSEHNSTKILLAFMAGAAVGAAIGYFLNSDKKDELVAEIKEGASKIKQSVDESLGKAKDFVENLKHAKTEAAEEAAPKA